MNILSEKVSVLKGIGKRREQTLSSVGILTLSDLLNYFPRKYRDLSKTTPIRDLCDGEIYAVSAKVVSDVKQKKTRTGLDMYTVTVSDNSDEMTVTLFNQAYLAGKLEKGKTFIFYGKVQAFGLGMSMTSPQVEEIENAVILPIYPLVKGLTQKLLRSLVGEALEKCKDAFSHTLSESIMQEYNLLTLLQAYNNVHFPQSDEMLSRARERLVFEEFFEFSVGIGALKRRAVKTKGIALSTQSDLNKFFNILPYELTGAQKRVIQECLSDMKKPVPMSRIVQGDVGSGKTVVAAALMYHTVKNGAQACMMAPTEILAIQHYDGLSKLLGEFGIHTALLTGSTRKKARTQILESLVKGEIDVLIGTHALIQNTVAFKNLALTITDEQHRFGVVQRSELSEKGLSPHKLVMSATPIPRTLALIMYGDLDISVIDELPPGRKKVSTFLVDSTFHTRMFKYLRGEIANGSQAYVVCPLVEESEDDTIKSAVEYASELTSLLLRGVSVKYLHGRMSPSEKEKALIEFKENKISVLVSTTVIEVGVDVPNASIMIIENAERFGLSQLHQLRGRVGRGAKKSYCFLVSDTESLSARERMEAFCQTTNGFEISQKDLELRGPGEFLGKNQSGDDMFKVGNLVKDIDILKKAQTAAENLWHIKGWYKMDEYRSLRQAVSKMFSHAEFDILS
ncbi:MAG: ATP-dependent DNA helicase RecG [Clostridiales bacterium]|nr:MAG: ATP-dependent DNA helicase RecG [Clostridiales bacterium]